MVHKKYIEKNGKRYGPYYYESYRDSEGNVKKRYIAHPKKSFFETIKNRRVTTFIALFTVLVLAFSYIYITGNPFTGGVVSEILPVYSLGETLGGKIQFNLREGEFIPADAVVTIKNGNQTKQLLLSDLILNQQKTTGDFYVENSVLSGQGEGFGVIGKKITYPEVLFELAISENKDSESSGSTPVEEPIIAPSEPIEQPIEELIVTEPVETETPVESEVPAETETTSTPESSETTESSQSSSESTPESSSTPSTSSESSDSSSSETTDSSSNSESSSDSSASSITGAVISEDSQIIQGAVRKGEEYKYILNENAEAEIVSGSAKVQDSSIEDSFLQLTTSNNEAVVTTDYELVEEGFGQDYLGNYSLALELDLSEFQIDVTDSLVELTLSYNEEVLLQAESLLIIEGQESPLANLTENVTQEIISNLTENITTQAMNITTQRAPIRLGEPVKWTKNVSLEIAESVKIDLPAEATNIIVKEKKSGNENEEDENKQEEILEPTEESLEIVNESIEQPTQEISEIAEVVEVTEVVEEPTEEIIEVPITETTLDSSGLMTGNAVVSFNLKKESKVNSWFKKMYSSITGRVVDEQLISPEIVLNESIEIIEVELPATSTEYVIEYETPAPTSMEQELPRGKQVIVSGPDNLNYQDVIAFTSLNENLKLKDSSKIKIQWVENQSEIIPLNVSDNDLNGIYDYIEWVVPHLSNQTFNIIVITNAEHLDENKTFVSDIYEQVKSQDDIWSEEIISGHYVRITFERNLSSGKDITVLPEIVSGNPRIEVYEKDGTEVIAEFTELNSNELNKVYLTGLEDRQQDEFDLKILDGNVKFDYIVDPDTGFVSVWRTTLTSTGSSNSTQVRLPLYNGGIYNFTVDWGDGVVNTVTAYNDGNATHNYPGAGGEYTINITGTIVGFRFNNAGDKLKLIDIQNWGPLNLGSTDSYFYGCTTMRITATDVLNLTGTPSMYFAFRTASNLTTVPSMNSWDMSRVNDTYYMFDGARYFNQNISEWDTSNVTRMTAMFQGTTYGPQTEFNQDISRWNTSKVTDMGSLFYYCKFNQSIANWDVSKVTTMSTMFRGSSFSQNISNWDTSNVTSMYAMFMEASFRGNISNWNISKLTSFSQMFQSGAVPYDIDNWDTSKITDMGSTFNYASFAYSNPDLDLGKWNMSKVTSTSNMLYGATGFSSKMYDNALSGWAKQPVNTGLTLNLVPARYCDVGAREVLDIYYAWTITDTGINSTCLADTTSPVYLFVSSNDTVVGSLTKFSAFWMDARQLNNTGQYIFSTNNTGTWVNDTAVNFVNNYEWANVTKRLNTTPGIAIGYRWYADDNAGNWNATEIYTITTAGDSVAPTSSYFGANSSLAGETIDFNVLIQDNGELSPRGQYIFSTNNTGVWTNDSAINFTTTPSWVNVTKTLNDTLGIVIGYMWYFKDDAGNWNTTPILKLTTRSDSNLGIYSCNDLQDINNYLIGSYALANNIDCSGTTSWNSGAGFLPIGNETNGVRFSGTLDGAGYNITGLRIIRAQDNYTGIFSSLSANGVIKNLGLVSTNVTGLESSGSLVGINYGLINNTFTQMVNVTCSFRDCGGLVGFQNTTGTINNSYVKQGRVYSSYYSGGFIGENNGTILNSYSTGTWVSMATGYGYTGGFVGYNYENGVLDNCSSSETTWGTANMRGGLVGYNSGLINNSYSTGYVYGSGEMGGFAGYNYVRGIILNSYATGNVTSSSGGSNGGVAGFVSRTYSGSFTNNSYSTGNVTSSGGSWNYVGGFVGDYAIGISNCYSTGNVNASDYYVGGFAGQIGGNLSNCYSTGNVVGRTSSTSVYVGGFVGTFSDRYSWITNCYSAGNVSAGANTYVAGFAGQVGADSSSYKPVILNSYATGNVTSTGTYRAGFVARNTSSPVIINNSYYYNGTGYPPKFSYNDVISGLAIASGDHPPYFYLTDVVPLNSWDFVNVWSNKFYGMSYPVFLWQNLTPSSDTVAPGYSSISSSGVVIETSANFSALWNDYNTLNPNGQYIFSTNNTGAWVNDTAVNFTSTPSWANVTKTLNDTAGIAVGYMWYASDNASNWNATSIQTLTTKDYQIQITNPTTENPVSVSGGDNISVQFNFLDNGANITSGVGFGSILVGGDSADILNNTFKIKGGKTSYTAGTLATVSFSSNMENTDYAVLSSFGTDAGVPFAFESKNKQVSGFNFQIEGYTGSNESVTNSHWAVIEYGEQNISNFLIKCNTGSGSNVATIPFTSAFPDANYAVVASTPIDDDSPLVSYTSKSTTNWTSRIEADDDTDEIVDGVDWCAVSYGNVTSGNVIIQAGYNTTTAATQKAIKLQTPFPDTNYVVLTTASMAGLTTDPCRIEIVSQTTTTFTITAEDDDSTNNCNGREFNWVAFSLGEFDATESTQFGYISGVGWQANVTVPNKEDSLEDLIVLASYNGAEVQGIEENSVNYAMAPTYSLIGSNSSYANHLTKFSALWNDNIALHSNGQYIFSTNNTGTWVNDSTVDFTATPEWANVTKTLNDTVGISIGYRWYANDNAGNWNATGINTLTTADGTAPTYSNVAYNNTDAGKATLFSVLWDDETALNDLGQYIFSTNNTGTWINDTAVNFTATPSWANVTKTLNNTLGMAIGYMWYARDNAGNWYSTGVLSISTGDTTPPVYSVVSHDYENANQLTTFSVLWDDPDLFLNPTGQYIFSTNNTGTWINDTAVNFTATPSWANVTKILNSTVGIPIGYMWYAKDNAGNWNATEINSFVTLTSGPAFSATWNTSKTSTGSSNSTQINLPLESTGNYNFLVNWGDGNIEIVNAYDSVNKTHNYASSGLYTINITGTIVGFRFNDAGDKLKLIEIKNWGPLNLGNSNSYFRGCSNLVITATDVLDLTDTIDMTNTFRSASSLTTVPSMNSWDMSKVNDTYGMFTSATNFNQNISEWDTSNVTRMGVMFYGCTAFNQDISRWNLSKVTDINQMFYQATNFNQPIGSWDVSKVTTMYNLFASATNFNQNLSNWDTSNVTSLQGTFSGASNFNGNISNWNTSKVTSLESTFTSAQKFNQSIGSWDVSKVINMNQTFWSASLFNQDISGWNTSNVEYMFGTLAAADFNQPIGIWDTGKVKTMRSMFAGASDFNQEIGDWNTSSALDMTGMFSYATSFNKSLGDWDTSKVTKMDRMFYIATSFDQNLSKWNISSLTNATEMLYAATLSTPNYDSLLTGWAAQTPNIQNSVNFHGGSSKYCVGGTVRDGILIGTHSWSITDGGVSSTCDLVAPTYSTISHNNSGLGQATLFSVLWDDETALNDLGQYIFSTNNTGAWVNDSAVNFTATPEWANVTKTLNTTIGISIGYMWYANDNAGNWNATEINVLTTIDGVAPGYSNVAHDKTASTEKATFSVLWNDDYTLSSNGQYIFSTNNTGTWVNDSAINFTATPNWANVTKYLNNTVGIPIGYMWYASDNAGNWNATEINVLTTTQPSVFSSVWNTSKSGSASNMVVLPLESSGIYDFFVDWGDGKTNTSTSYLTNHTYDTPGVYTINITGTIQGFRFNNAGDKLKLIEIKNWGPLNLGNSASYFYGCSNLIVTATDTLNLTGTKTMYNMFRDASSLTTVPSMNSWDTSQVTVMNYTFSSAYNFNQDISDWDTSQVTTMDAMFYSATSFNQNINSWNTSKVDDMSLAFYNADSFTQDLNGWDTSNVLEMRSMFMNNDLFNGNITSWDTRNVYTMQNMFNNADAFNQPIGTWNVSNVTTMESMFAFNANFNQNLENWNTGKVTTFASMFEDAVAFNGSLANWNTGKVTTMDSMFEGATNFNGNISNWNTSSLTGTGLSHTFYDASSFNQPLNNWNTSGITSLSWTFLGASSFNQDLDKWDVSKVGSFQYLFNDAVNFNGNVSTWNTSSATIFDGVFNGAFSFNQPIGSWDTSKVTWFQHMFRNAMSFNQDISGWSTSSATNMWGMFYGAISFNQDLSSWVFPSVTNLGSLFYNATSFNQNLSNWNVSKITDMTDMFKYATLSTANYDSLLNGWASQSPNLKNSVPFHGGNSKYSLAGNASRNGVLIGIHSWSITDGGFIDLVAPTYSNVANNSSNAGETVLFSVLWDDETALNAKGQYIFSTNNTGTWINDSAINFTATPNWANVTQVLNDTNNTPVGYIWYAKDDAGNWNVTEINVVVALVTNSAPNNPIVTINSTDGSNKTAQDLNCFANITDPDAGNTMNVSLRWWKNDTINLTQQFDGNYANATIFNTVLDDGNTSKGDVWKCEMLLSDGIANSSWVNSSALTILNTLPTVTLSEPENGNITQDRTPSFSWSGSDDDGDSLTYQLGIVLEASSLCSDPDRNITGIGLGSHTLEEELRCLLDNGDYYLWSVAATDGVGYGEWATQRNISIVSLIEINLTNRAINFGVMNQFESNDTSDDNPLPFKLQNIGNALVNITVQGSSLWESAPSPTEYLKYKAANRTDSNSFNFASSITGFTILPLEGSPEMCVAELNYTDGNDIADIDIYVEVPPNEYASSSRHSNITFTASLAE